MKVCVLMCSSGLYTTKNSVPRRECERRSFSAACAVKLFCVQAAWPCTVARTPATNLFHVSIADRDSLRQETLKSISSAGTKMVLKEDQGMWEQCLPKHVRYKSLYTLSPSSTKQQHVLTKFCVFWGTWATTAIFFVFAFEFFPGITYLVWAGFGTICVVDRFTAMGKSPRDTYLM